MQVSKILLQSYKPLKYRPDICLFFVSEQV